MLFERSSREIEWAREVLGQSWEGRAARVVQVAHRVGLFEALARGETTAAAVAARLGLDPVTLEKVLIACAALGLAAREEDRWQLTSKARATLVPGAPLYQGNAIAHIANTWAVWQDLEHALRGEAGWSVFSSGETSRPWSHRDWILAMHNMSMAGRAAELASRVDLVGRKTLLDVGGGPGTYAMALCERFGELHATVLDLPETVAIARETIARLGMADRVGAQECDWNVDEFGRDADAVLMSNVLHGPTSRAAMKLAKAHRALKPGGLLVIQDFLLNAEKTGPLKPALFNVMVGAYSLPELAALVEDAGFAGLRHEPLPEDMGTTLMTAAKPGRG